MAELLFTSLIQNLVEIGYETGFARGQDNTKALFRLRCVEPIDIRVAREPVTRAIELAHRLMGCHRPRGLCLRKRNLAYIPSIPLRESPPWGENRPPVRS